MPPAPDQNLSGQFARRTRQLQRLSTLLRQEVKRRKHLEAMLTGVEQHYISLLQLLDEVVVKFHIGSDNHPAINWHFFPDGTIGGYTDEELEALGGVIGLVHPDDQANVRMSLKAILEGEQPTIEIRVCHKSGENQWLRVRNFPIWNRNHTRVTHFYAIARDITRERQDGNRQLRFVGNAIHELAHPISNLLLRTHMMRRRPEAMEHHLDALEPIAQQLRLMVEDMRELAYLERGELQPQPTTVRIRDLLTAVIAEQTPHAQGRQIELRLEVPTVQVDLRLDTDYMKKALTALVHHAIANCVIQPGTVNIRLEGSTGRGSVWITIEYAGAHIPPDVNVFTPFILPSEGASRRTGMELAIARALIELHGGQVHFICNPIGQSYFQVWLSWG